nr:hypothetical protein L203_02755 [Cryptococcus depauperatus CBS 7841]
MSDSLPADAWINNFLAAPPRPLLANLQKRLVTSSAHLVGLAEVYKQRAQIEAHYADNLAKLARSADAGTLSGLKNGNDWPRNSAEARIWDSVVSEITETSTTHSTLAAMLRADFEQPLRDLPTNVVAWRRIAEQDASLDKALRDYEKTSAKLEKASAKSKPSKIETLQSDLNQLTTTLSSLSPSVYTTYQRLDEERLKALKEITVRWGTVKGDIANRDSSRSESIISSLLSWEVQDEILNVGQKLGGGGMGAGSASKVPPPRIPESSASTPRSNRRLSMATSSATHDFSPRASTPRVNGTSATANTSAPGSSFASGFKSMLGRTKTMSARNRSGSNAASTRSGTRENFGVIGEEPPRVPDMSHAPHVDEEGFSVAPADRHRGPWEDPNLNIPVSSDMDSPTATANSTNVSKMGQATSSTSDASQEDTISPTLQNQQPRLNLSLAPQPIQESEEERQAALAKMQKTLQLPPSQPSRRSTIARGRRDVRNTMFAGSTDEGTIAGAGATAGLAAFASPKFAEPEEQLVESPKSTRFNTQSSFDVPSQSPLVRRTSLSSVSSNNPFDSPGTAAAMTPPIVSSSSDHPGLRANMSEHINVIFRNKEIAKFQIAGEIHLSLRPVETASLTGPIHICLSAFERLEKIAPNPAYLAQVPDKPGEYFLNAEMLAAATTKGAPGGRGILLFKYVVHVQPGKEFAHLPLILDPAFQCKSGETRMILHYHLNSSSTISSLSNVNFAASFAPGPSVVNVQAKPTGGVWSPLTRRIQWKLDELPSDGKIIAKFLTEGEDSMSPIGIQAAWAVEGKLISGLGIDIVSGEIEGNWKFDEIRKSTTTGKYLVEPVV